MTDIESARTGYTKLYHPRGPLVSLPVVGDNPAAMFACVTAMLDAGFVVAAPGLEVGEEREMVSGVLRSTFEHDGEITDIILLYAANEAMKYSFLKLYLNDENDVKAFESACGIKLDILPIYEGKDKPERDGKSVALKYIAKLPRPVPVVFKQNPKWIEEEANAAKAQNKLYTKPRRVFVRWADAAPASAPAETQKPSELDVAVEAWKVRLANVIGVDDMNKTFPMVKAIADEAIAKRAWRMCLDCADAHKWVFDKDAKVFRHAAEMTTTPPPTKPAPAVAPPAAVPPPPDDAVSPLIAAWQKKLDPITVNLAKLNGEVLTAFKSIGKTEPDRQNVWVMLVTFAQEHGCDFDASSMKFVERMP